MHRSAYGRTMRRVDGRRLPDAKRTPASACADAQARIKAPGLLRKSPAAACSLPVPPLALRHGRPLARRARCLYALRTRRARADLDRCYHRAGAAEHERDQRLHAVHVLRRGRLLLTGGHPCVVLWGCVFLFA
jgi:hypothetical protein